MGGWVGVWGGEWLRSTAYDSSHVCTSPQSISHERLMTNDFFFSGDESKQAPLPLLSPPQPPRPHARPP